MANVFDVRDYGATGDDGTIDSNAINAAIKAAHDAGGGTVNIPAGVFLVQGTSDKSDGAIRLLSNVTVHGAGMGQTVLKVAAGWSGAITGIVRTPYNEVTKNAGLYDLSLDGNRANTSGTIDGFYCGVAPSDPRQDEDITAQRVEVLNCSHYGFDPHEETIRLKVADCISHDNGLDGFVADYIVDGVYSNDVAYNNARHGFNVTTTSTNLLLQGNTSYDNGSSGLAVQRGSEAIPWPNGVTVSGGDYYGNTREGVILQLASGVTIDNAHIHGNGYQGIRIDGATNTTVENSSIFDNSQSSSGGYDEINIRPRADTVTKKTYYSTNALIHDNIIYDDASVRSRYGIEEDAGNVPAGSSSSTRLTDDAGTTTSDNQISGPLAGDISVPGYGTSAPPTGTSGNDTLQGTPGADKLNGLAGDDVIYGYAGSDSLVGGAGNDTLDGGTGADTMVGGVGNDIYVVDHTGDVVTESPSQGTDGVVSSIKYTLGANVENLTLAGTANINGYGNSIDNVLTGNAGNNVLKSYDGNDTLDGGMGADAMTGGTGNDVYVVDNTGDTVTESSSSGTDLVMSSISLALSSNVENLTLTGTAAIDATGNTLANLLTGNDGSNKLDGGVGPDTMSGGGGNDFYYVDNTGDVVLENAASGHDLVNSSISYILPGNVEDLTLTGSALNGTGNALDNIITGNAGANKITGGLGSDFLTGGAGADMFVYQSTSESAGTQGSYDTIADFAPGIDKIDLSAIHGSNGLQLGWGGQTDSVGSNQVTWSYDGSGHATVQADTTGDGTADFKLQLNGWTSTSVLSESDFKLK